jgi:hypothetical protein
LVVRTYPSAGLDGIPAAFVKHAFYVTGNRPSVRIHVLRPRGFLLAMQHNPGLAVKRFKPRPTRTASPISVEVWTEYVDQHFKGGRGAQLSLLPEMPSDAALLRAQHLGMPSVDSVLLEVEQALRELKVDTAPGLDGVGATFLKHAVRRSTQYQINRAPEYLLAPVLAELFLLVFQTRQIPNAWKVARLVPFHKKGDRDDPANYRLIAISSVVYRLFASVLNSLLTKWCIRQGVLPIEQFGFVPGPMSIVNRLNFCYATSPKAGKFGVVDMVSNCGCRLLTSRLHMTMWIGVLCGITCAA